MHMFNGKEYEIWDMLERKKIKLKAAYQKILSEKTIKNSPEKIYMILKKYIERILLLIDTYQDQNLYALDRENWRKLYKKIKEHGDLSKELAVQFLPVTLKTNYLDDELKQIISPVYEMLKNNTIDFEQWNKIQVLLPEVEAYQSWDRCLRVRIALKNKGCSEIV